MKNEEDLTECGWSSFHNLIWRKWRKGLEVPNSCSAWRRWPLFVVCPKGQVNVSEILNVLVKRKRLQHNNYNDEEDPAVTAQPMQDEGKFIWIACNFGYNKKPWGGKLRRGRVPQITWHRIVNFDKQTFVSSASLDTGKVGIILIKSKATVC